MAGPMAAVSIGTSLIGGITQAYAGREAGRSQAAMYNYQAGVASVNADINRQNAEWAVRAGEVGAQKKGFENRYRIGQIKTAQAASGFDVGGKSAVATRESQREIGLYDQAVIRSNAARTAFGYETEAKQSEAQSNIYRMSATNARRAGTLAGLQSILGTASSVSSRWSQASQAGIFGGSSSGSSTYAFGQSDIGGG